MAALPTRAKDGKWKAQVPHPPGPPASPPAASGAAAGSGTSSASAKANPKRSSRVEIYAPVIGAPPGKKIKVKVEIDQTSMYVKTVITSQQDTDVPDA